MGQTANRWEFPNLVVQTWLLQSLRGSALLRYFGSFAGLEIALFCALLRSFACFCERPRLERPRLGTPEIASVQRTLSTVAGHSAGPLGTNTTPTYANRAIRIAMQRRQGLRGPNSVFLGGAMTANER